MVVISGLHSCLKLTYFFLNAFVGFQIAFSPIARDYILAAFQPGQMISSPLVP